MDAASVVVVDHVGGNVLRDVGFGPEDLQQLRRDIEQEIGHNVHPPRNRIPRDVPEEEVASVQLVGDAPEVSVFEIFLCTISL